MKYAQNVITKEVYQIITHEPYPGSPKGYVAIHNPKDKSFPSEEYSYLTIEDFSPNGAYQWLDEKEFKSILNPNPRRDMIDHPDHYTAGGIETIEFIEAKLNSMPHLTPFQAYCVGNVIKYMSRLGLKDDLYQDLGKAIKYAEWAQGGAQYEPIQNRFKAEGTE